MICPKCNSENTQRLEVVYDNGTNDINTQSHSSIFGFGRGGLGFGLGKTKTKGTSQSGLAQKSAPPAKKKIKLQIIIILIGSWFLMHPTIKFAVFGTILVASGAFLIYKKINYNKQTLPGLYQEWVNSWLCTKCGSVYQFVS